MPLCRPLPIHVGRSFSDRICKFCNHPRWYQSGKHNNPSSDSAGRGIGSGLKGDLGVQVSARTNDEISILTESFNTMVTSLQQSQKELLNAYDNTLEGWAKALELRDKETQGHSERVIELTIQSAVEMGIHGEALTNIRRGALFTTLARWAFLTPFYTRKDA